MCYSSDRKEEVIMNNQDKIDMWLMTNSKYLPNDKIIYVKERLSTIDEGKWSMLQTVDFKDPVVLLVVSLLIGSLGVDRFMVGDIGLGVLKLLTFGLCGILTIIDWFLITKKTKEVNFQKLAMII